MSSQIPPRQIGKGQRMRLVDVFLLGPFLVWYGIRSDGMGELERAALVASGVGTIVYNARNYRLVAEGELR